MKMGRVCSPACLKKIGASVVEKFWIRASCNKLPLTCCNKFMFPVTRTAFVLYFPDI